MKDSGKQLGERLADQLGIEVQAPRAAQPTNRAPTLDNPAEALAAFVGLPGVQSDAELTGVDRAIAIADRVAAGGQLTDSDCDYLWSAPALLPAFSKRLELERAVAGEGKHE